MTFGAVILAGGDSRRFGRDKASLTYNGTSFLSGIAKELSCFEERLLSVAEPRQDALGLRQVCDVYLGSGPMAGIHASLLACSSDALLFVPCDVPLFSGELGEHLCSLLSDEYDAVIATSFEGIDHPLCAVYRKSAASAFQAALENGGSISDVLKNLRVLKAPIWEADFPDRLLVSVSTPEEYARFCGASITNIFLVGATGSDKSGVIEMAASLQISASAASPPPFSKTARGTARSICSRPTKPWRTRTRILSPRRTAQSRILSASTLLAAPIWIPPAMQSL